MTLELQNISKSFDGLPVLRNLNLSFHQGQCYCLMSPSGSGKTTLLRILMGLEQADHGLILADGKPQDMNSLTVSAVFQEDRLCVPAVQSKGPASDGNWPACFRRNA